MKVSGVARAAGIGSADVLLTAGLLVATVLAVYLLPAGWLDGRDIDGFGLVLLGLLTLPVLVRRAWPMPALAVCVAPQVVYHAMDYPHEVTLPVAVVLIYTVALMTTRTRLLVMLGLVTMALLLTIGLTNEGPPGVEVALPMGWFIAAAVAGQAVRIQHVTREEEAARRVAEERLRIARDLHDVLAHNIVVINTHAGVAAHLLDERTDDPLLAQIAESLHTVASASSGALAELRTTLDVLRGNDSDDRSDRQPAPGIDALPELAEQTRAAGVEVLVERRGERRSLGQSVEVTLYRIAQEALTNVIKHAGATRATLVLDYAPDQVRLEVTDNGRGGASLPGDNGGYGIIGMTERAHALGGRLVAGARPEGGFQVTGTLPSGGQAPRPPAGGAPPPETPLPTRTPEGLP